MPHRWQWRYSFDGCRAQRPDRIGVDRAARGDACSHRSQLPRRDCERTASRGLEALELRARIDQVAGALARALPADFESAASIVEAAAADPMLGIWELWPVTVWVGGVGAADVDRAARLLALITPRCSGEFGVRPLIDADPQRMLATLLEWARSSDDHIRRLASEGPRPLLPWAPRLTLTASDPGWALPVLDLLAEDASAYVRRSVANHLNDISKLDPGLAIATAQRWKHRDGDRLDSILRHGMRTLTRRGQRQALALVGLDPDAAVSVERLTATPETPRLGDTVEFEITLRSSARRPVATACGYVIEFARRSGRPSRKLFTLGTISLAPGQSIELRRRYVFRALSTRPYHPGTHAVEVMVNGRPRAHRVHAGPITRRVRSTVRCTVRRGRRR